MKKKTLLKALAHESEKGAKDCSEKELNGLNNGLSLQSKILDFYILPDLQSCSKGYIIEFLNCSLHFKDQDMNVLECYEDFAENNSKAGNCLHAGSRKVGPEITRRR